MIAFDFEFFQPTSVEDAINLYEHFDSEQKNVIYYSGGTEFISRARRNEVLIDVVIDLKKIPECGLIETKEDEIVIGSAVSLSNINDNEIFPLLSRVCRKIATRTERNKITIGGNIASNLPYKEVLLALLVSNSDLLIASEKGTYRKNIHDFMKPEGMLKQSEFIVQIMTKNDIVKQPYFYFRRTPQSSINYPVLSMACLMNGDKLNVSFSGLCSFPFRSTKIEKVLNEQLSTGEKYHKIIHLIPDSIVDDFIASSEYRLFVLENALQDLEKKLG